MLKDIFKKNNKPKEDVVAKTLLDGYIDIKAYKYDNDNNKTLIYHDTGDNTVTNWARQVIMQFLAGINVSDLGNGGDEAISNPLSNVNVTTYNRDNHGETKNLDGCLISDADLQYLHDSQSIKIKYTNYDLKNHLYPLYPTKVLFGTGKEYINWESLKEENEIDNSSWYEEMVEAYSSGEGENAAKNQVNNLIQSVDSYVNTYSSTYGTQGTHDGSGSLLPAITVNDPDPDSILEETPADLSNRYGVVGAIKTLYLPGVDTAEIDGEPIDEVLNPTISDDGRLIKARYRGVGRPCFIYFNRTIDQTDDGYKLDWSQQTSGVYVSKENSSGINYLNRITFKIVMPAQKGTGSSLTNAYYPYNGYTLKQVGLFNDSLLGLKEGVKSTYADKMPCGTLLAIKNISTFTKTADEEIVFTWTLTI